LAADHHGLTHGRDQAPGADALCELPGKFPQWRDDDLSTGRGG
jgi:hypothetical protein